MTIVLFTGDSITDAGQQFDPSLVGPGSGLGAGYVRRIAEIAATEAPGLQVLNTGISGHRTTDLLRRWDADVIDLQPNVLTILIGINDMWRRYDAGTPMLGAEFRSNYTQLLERVAVLRLRNLVVLEPFLLPFTEEQEAWPGEDLDEKRAIAFELAGRFDAVFIPLQAIFTDRAVETGAASLTIDGVHPSAAGHELIAQTWWSTVGSSLS